MAKKCTKIYNARAQLLFCSSNFLFGDVLVAVVVSLSSLLTTDERCMQNPIFTVKADENRSMTYVVGLSFCLVSFFIDIFQGMFLFTCYNNHNLKAKSHITPLLQPRLGIFVSC